MTQRETLASSQSFKLDMITCNYGGEAALRTMHLQLETKKKKKKIIWSAHLAVRRLLVDFGVTSPEKCKWLVLLGEGGRYYFASLLPSEPYRAKVN